MWEIALICLLTEEVNTYYRNLRQKLSAQFGIEINLGVPAHITLKYGFPVENIRKIEEVVRIFSEFQPRAKWELCGFGHFSHPDRKIVFLDVRPGDGIQVAHLRLLDKLRLIPWVKWGQFDGPSWHYHVTLAAQGITTDNFGDVLSFLEDLEEPVFEANFDNIALFRVEKDPPFIYRKFDFA